MNNPMKILIDLQHPAHLHFFRNLITRLQTEGHTVRITGRDKDILVDLAMNYSLEIEFFGVARKGILNLGRELLFRQWCLYRIIKKFKPDLMMAIAGTYTSLLGKLMGVPTYVFYDTEHATISNLLAYPFATCIYVPRCYRKNIHWRHVRYNGYHELAYLHPKYFRSNPTVLEEVGLQNGEIFTIVRFVGWSAAHDLGQKGLTTSQKIRVVERLKRYGKVLISAEGKLPTELEHLRLHLNVSRIHDLIAHAALIFGESATMPSEGAILGTPSVYISPLRLGYLEDQEQDFGIVFNFSPEQVEDAIQKGISILENFNKERWKKVGNQIIEEKIDVTDMLYRIVKERPFIKDASGSKKH